MRILFMAIIGLAWLGAGYTNAVGQHLKRRPLFGFQAFPINDSIQKAHRMPQPQGLVVMRMRPDGTFAALGGQVGDVILSINGSALRTDADLLPALKGLSGDDPVAMEVSRQGKKLNWKGKLLPMPLEQSNGAYKVEYGEAAFQNGWIRTIVRRPHAAGTHPTIYFVPGYTCASTDNLPAFHPYTKLLDTLGRLGYVIYRIEKPGVGDGPHPCDCASTGFDLELSVFETGYRDMLSKPYVDPQQVFVFGHSMGGIQAPLFAAKPEFNPKGIALYGTAFQSWYEYILNMLRFQNPRNGLHYKEFEADMREYVKLFYAHYVEMKPLEEIVKNEAWKALLVRDFELNAAGDLLGRRAFYWQELAKTNATEAWVNVRAHVLSIYGSADFEVFNPFSMEEIVRIVNAYHPGKGTFVQLEGADHGMIDVGSMEEGLGLRNTPAYRAHMEQHFDMRIVDTLHGWIQRILREG